MSIYQHILIVLIVYADVIHTDASLTKVDSAQKKRQAGRSSEPQLAVLRGHSLFRML